MNSRTAISVVSVLAGAGLGLMAAEMLGVSPWLDAKLYMAAGVGLGAGVAALAERFRSDR